MQTTAVIPSPFDLMSSNLGMTKEEVLALKSIYEKKRLYSDTSLGDLREKILNHQNKGNQEKLKARLEQFALSVKNSN